MISAQARAFAEELVELIRDLRQSSQSAPGAVRDEIQKNLTALEGGLKETDPDKSKLQHPLSRMTALVESVAKLAAPVQKIASLIGTAVGSRGGD
jgi:hypothetical protein